MPVELVSASEFKEKVLDRDIPVVVGFFADWCGPCHQVAPEVERLSREWEGEIAFAQLDIDRDAEVARSFRISSVPAVLLFEHGEVRGRSIGAKPSHLIERDLGLAERRTVSNRRRAEGDAGREMLAWGPVGMVRTWWRRQ
ncbi:MAG TPA: thioredoxin domain-containing protein [Actinomycetota bacterium]|nr:thioredoxin domain-containing protein [Actinomycetota bacterium]